MMESQRFTLKRIWTCNKNKWKKELTKRMIKIRTQKQCRVSNLFF